ncbi:MAG: formyltransferase [Methylacidiphilales bacterium]|nr:formyltransferase [Candidatus Methylacidiphilales bacterium]
MSPKRPRIVVFAYSEVGYACLDLLISRGANIAAVFTHRDDPHEQRWFRSVPELAESHGLTVFYDQKTGTQEWLEKFRNEIEPELILSFYYRKMISTQVLKLAWLGAFNMHGSYLPKYRGKAPVNWAVLNGESFTGTTLHHMVQEPDAGDIVDQEKVPIGPEDSALHVMTRVVEASRLVLDRQLKALLSGTAPRMVQDHSQATYYGGRGPEDGRIDWAWPSSRIFNLVRAVTRPYPGAFADFPDGRRLKVWWAKPLDLSSAPGTITSTVPLVIAAGEGALEITDYEWTSTPARG